MPRKRRPQHFYTPSPHREDSRVRRCGGRGDSEVSAGGKAGYFESFRARSGKFFGCSGFTPTATSSRPAGTGELAAGGTKGTEISSAPPCGKAMRSERNGKSGPPRLPGYPECKVTMELRRQGNPSLVARKRATSARSCGRR